MLLRCWSHHKKLCSSNQNQIHHTQTLLSHSHHERLIKLCVCEEHSTEILYIIMSMLLPLVFFFFFFFSTSRALWLTIPPSGTKCVSEEIHSNIVVVVHYSVVANAYVDSPNATISAKVSSPYGNELHHMDSIKVGNFAFTSRESGLYLACFWVARNDRGGDVVVDLDWKTGIAAKDWDSVAKREKIQGVELELKKLEGSVESIHENLMFLRGREAEMRNVSESTNTRVMWFSFLSLGVCIAVSVLQLLHLKRYFHKKKLI